MRRSFVALSLLAVLGCGGSNPSDAATAAASQGAPGDAVVPPGVTVPAPNDPVAVGTPAPEPTPAPVAAGDDPCSAAAFALAGSTVIATVNGEPVRADALGPDARDAEREALHGYCQEVYRIRDAATRRAVEDRLLENAARTAGTSTEEFVRGKLADAVARPSPEEVEAFYKANASEQAPPFEMVKGQVEEAMLKERSQAAFADLIGSLRKEATIAVNLPDVRPPPFELAAADHTATYGPKDAKVHLVEFSDFECPYCARAAMGLSAVKQRLGDKVEVSYRHFPLSFHPAAQPAAEMAQCAHEQGKFWEMHDEIFANQPKLSEETLREMATNAGLDLAKLDECLASGRARSQVMVDLAKGQEVGVRGTPSFYIDGRPYDGGTSPDELVAAVEAALAGT